MAKKVKISNEALQKAEEIITFHGYSSLEELIEKGINSGDSVKVAAAEATANRLDEILNSKNHRWYIDKMDPAEKEKRKIRQADFKARYTK